MTGVEEVGDDSGDTSSRGNLRLSAKTLGEFRGMVETHFASVDHDAQLHERGVDISRILDRVNTSLANGGYARSLC